MLHRKKNREQNTAIEGRRSYSNYTSTKYIVTSCITPHIVITLSVLFVIWIIQSIKIIELIFNHEAPIKYFLQLSLYIVPYIIFITTPIALICTLLYVTKKMWHDNELTILQCLGRTKVQITKSFLLFALSLCLFHYLISFYIMPLGYRNFRILEKEVESQYATILIEEGSFNKFYGLTLYVGQKVEKNKFANIFIYDARIPNQKNVITAEYGEIAINKAKNAIRLIIHNGSYQEENKKTKHNSILFFENYNIEIDLGSLAAIKEDRILEANERYLMEMLAPNDKINLDQKQYNKIITYGHQRIIWPLTNITITLIIMATILRRCKGRKSNNAFINAFLISITFLLINVILQNMAIKNLLFIYGLYSVVILPIFYIWLYTKRYLPHKHGQRPHT